VRWCPLGRTVLAKKKSEDVKKSFVKALIGEVIKKNECTGKRLGEGIECLER
jgi:hypothetical protein